MNMPILSQMEDRISRLSLDEQLWLMERLVQRIKENTVSPKSQIDNDLIAMANDPEIQNELREIEKEFAFASKFARSMLNDSLKNPQGIYHMKL